MKQTRSREPLERHQICWKHSEYCSRPSIQKYFEKVVVTFRFASSLVLVNSRSPAYVLVCPGASLEENRGESQC
jgi:hypothetical protein